MPIYWGLLILSLLGMWIESSQVKINPLTYGSIKSKACAKTELHIALLTLLPLLIILSFRDNVLDTYGYIIQFNEIPWSWDHINFEGYNNNGIAFLYLATAIKILFQCDHYLWFFILALINLYCITKVCVKYSPNLSFSIFLFIAGTSFTWCLNGTRQFLAITVLFYFSNLLLSDKLKDKLIYIAIIIGLGYVHSSALFLIPIAAVISSKRLFGPRMILIVIATLIGTYFSDSVFGSAMEIMGKEYSTLNDEGRGSTVLRLLFTLVPIVIVLFNYNNVRRIAPPPIILGINMCLVGGCFMFVSTFTNGILIGRMPGYFNIYALYVIPWLTYNCFGKNRGLVSIIFIVVYIVWFYFQMVVAWHNLPYGSDFLNLHYD